MLTLPYTNSDGTPAEIVIDDDRIEWDDWPGEIVIVTPVDIEDRMLAVV